MSILTQPEHSYINGRSYPGRDLFTVFNPASEQSVCEVSNIDLAGEKAALVGAQTALITLSHTSAAQRARVLSRWYHLLQVHEQELAELIVAEQGKPLHEALGEVRYSAGFIDWFAQEAIRNYGEIIPSHDVMQQLSTIKQPVGIVLGVTPWNFPLAMITRKVAPAYAAGCSFILKPSEETPLSAIALAKLAIQAGMEPGAFQVVIAQKPAEMIKRYCQQPEIRKLTFTGSTAVGRCLLAQCADTVKRTSMELGGNAPFIVYGSANLDAAVQGLIAAKFRNNGQTCVAANRVFVERSCFDRFVIKLLEAVKKLKVGDGMEPDVDLGPMINHASKNKVLQLVATSVEQGAKVLYQGEKFDGLLMSPVVLSNITPDMPLARQEIFGPVIALTCFSDEQQSIELANAVDAGLAAYFYSQNASQVHRVSRLLDYCMVGINEGLISNPVAPFGGIKQSGLGREGAKQGLDEYLEIKYLCQKFD